MTSQKSGKQNVQYFQPDRLTGVCRYPAPLPHVLILLSCHTLYSESFDSPDRVSVGQSEQFDNERLVTDSQVTSGDAHFLSDSDILISKRGHEWNHQLSCHYA